MKGIMEQRNIDLSTNSGFIWLGIGAHGELFESHEPSAFINCLPDDLLNNNMLHRKNVNT
jgi:hypothetical protein